MPPRRPAEPIELSRVILLAAQGIGGSLYAGFVCSLTLVLVEGTSAAAVRGFAAVTLLCAAPAISLLFARRFLAFAAGILLAIGLFVLLLGICAPLKGV